MNSYRVRPAEQRPLINADWDQPAYSAAETLQLTHCMGERPAHFPDVQARVLYDAEALYVIFRVADRYVRAVARAHQDAVYRDSCVEFFFTPGEDVAPGYFNLEMNCGGTLLFHHQVVPRRDAVAVAPADVERISIAHTQPHQVDPEIAEPTTWCVEYRLPVEILARYAPKVQLPAPGVRWRANFYKCADATTHPHWLTWSKVESPRPDFHRPADFGELIFE